MSENIVTKAAVSITDMSRMVSLSRARFGQLVRKGTFPAPDKDPTTNRPFYSEEKQRICLEVRRRNCGIDGKAILFYARRSDLGQSKSVKRAAKPKVVVNQYADLIDHLAQATVIVTAAEVGAVVKELFPEGTVGIDPGEVFLAVFKRFQRNNTPGKQGK